MNHAVSHAHNDWVLCMDSDEILDQETVDAILKLKWAMNPNRIWRGGYVVTGLFWEKMSERFIRLITGLSGASFNRTQSRFNNRPVDDQVEGFLHSERILAMSDMIHFIHCMNFSIN